ncbi:MAG: hypothetical protein PVG74_06580 [Desulfobacterales bacterium]|jgi:hypothetical protein
MPRKVFLNLETLKFPYPSLIYLVCLIALGLTASPSTTASGPAEFILGWDANAEADLDGYEIYVRKGIADASYLFLSEVYVDELEDPDNPRVTITDLYNGLLTDMITPVVRIAELSNNSTYHFALTAFDTQGNISDFSEELCVEVIGTSVAECRSADDGSDPGETDGNDSETIDSGDGSGGDVSAENSVNSSSGGGGGCFIETSLSNFH